MRPNTAVCLVILGLLLLPLTVAAQETVAMTNQDVTKLVRASLSTEMVLRVIGRAPVVTFDLSPAGLVALKADGVPEVVIEAMLEADRKGRLEEEANSGARMAPERSRLVAPSREPATILRNARTLYVSAKAVFFDAQQMKAALGENRDFTRLGLTIVDDPGVADLVLDVTYTPVWDYPFTLRHQNTSMVLLSGVGEGPFSGPLGAINVAAGLADQLKPYRTPAAKR